eukprot:7299927-Alexandrium_andersonii.AAC.1
MYVTVNLRFMIANRLPYVIRATDGVHHEGPASCTLSCSSRPWSARYCCIIISRRCSPARFTGRWGTLLRRHSAWWNCSATLRG